MTKVLTFDDRNRPEDLLGEFMEGLRLGSAPDYYSLLQRCPEEFREELRSEMKTAELMHWAVKRAEARRTGSPLPPSPNNSS